MFGYVRVKQSELRLRDFECYRAYYCGLCRAMGKCTGQCSRLSLSYDFVFLASVRSAIGKETPKIVPFRCIVHPFRRRKAVENSPALAYCADASALLTYGKIEDDLSDERGRKRLRARLASIGFGHAYRRAKKRYPGLNATVQKYLKDLRDYEKSATHPSADEPASIFGELMRAVFSEGLEGSDARIAGEIGRAIGHWIYLIDAADDLSEDVKRGRFNPYVGLFGEHPTEEDLSLVSQALDITLAEATRALDLIDSFPYPELKQILWNILTLGLRDTSDRVLGTAKEKGTHS